MEMTTVTASARVTITGRDGTVLEPKTPNEAFQALVQSARLTGRAIAVRQDGHLDGAQSSAFSVRPDGGTSGPLEGEPDFLIEHHEWTASNGSSRQPTHVADLSELRALAQGAADHYRSDCEVRLPRVAPGAPTYTLGLISPSLQTTPSQVASPEPAQAAAVVSPEPEPSTEAPIEQSATRREARQSFLAQQREVEKASSGWRGALASLGLRVEPSKEELAYRGDLHAVSQHWPGPRTISVVNGKGGAGKTPTTVLLSAVFARHGGGAVLAWDNNQTRGTLGWRTEQGPHDATLLELLPQTQRLLSTSAQTADLAHYVHHQTRDRFDVLRSKPVALAKEQRITSSDVDALHSVAAKYYRLIIIDSGNDESDPMWLRMIDHTDQLVIATTTRDDHAEAGALLLEALHDRDARSAQLASQAVTVVNQSDPKASAADIARVTRGYRDLTREVVTIPHDPAMVDGLLRHDALRSTTQQAWLHAAAAVARGL
jgi:MinD-like ATPase involved in chromosome partitioning or flagellar assembly